MFKELLNFRYKRSKKQAFGFYLFHLVTGILFALLCLCFVIACLVTLKVDIINVTDPNKLGNWVGSISAVIYYSSIVSMILVSKKLYTSSVPIILLVLTLVFSIFGGGLFGCIFPAVLTTFESKE